MTINKDFPVNYYMPPIYNPVSKFPGIQPTQFNGFQYMQNMGTQVGMPLAFGWGTFAGGLYGASSLHDQMFAGNAAPLAAPGKQAMEVVNKGNEKDVGKMDNLVEIAGTGMGKDQKYKMLPGELLAVHSILTGGEEGKDGKKANKNLKPEELQKQLLEKFGIDTEIKTEGKTKVLVNKASGNVIMADANGDGVLGVSDMKFDDALKQVKERYNIDSTEFGKIFDKTKGGMGVQQGFYQNPFGGNMPNYGGFFPGAGNYGGFFPGVGNYAPVAGNQAPVAGNQAPGVQGPQPNNMMQQMMMMRMWQSFIMMMMMNSQMYANQYAPQGK
jgi:hypothetical protein